MAWKRTLSWALNVVSVSCAGLVIWQFARNYFPSSARSGDITGLVGSNVRLADVSWRDAPRTIVLALSTQCQFCRMGAGFYRSLVDSARPDRFQVIAALRESAEDARPHLAELGIEKVKDVRQVDEALLDVRVTPTVLVVDRRGAVEAAWAGKLTPSQEKEVFEAVQTEPPPQAKAPASADAPVNEVQAAELRTLLENPDTILLDIRERSRFYEAHIPGALNMPLDELVPRVPHELPADRTILLYCVEYNGKTCAAQQGFTTWGCEDTRRALGHLGISKVRAIAGDLAKLAEAGIRVQGKPCRQNLRKE